MDYKLKYEIYKSKYLSLKNQKGGSINKPTLYLFKAEWCGHCKHFAPEWEKLKNNNEIKNKINFVTMDSEINKNEINKNWKIEGFPTIILNKGDIKINYNSSRTEENIVQFINQHIN
jgi:protein disulfide-isomerase A4